MQDLNNSSGLALFVYIRIIRENSIREYIGRFPHRG